MSSYSDFAYIYDKLMQPDIDYCQLCDYIENIFDMHSKSIDLVADLACGTGNVTIPLSKRGYDMIGVDLSEEMLCVARDKAYTENENILFLNQNMISLDLYGTVDAFVCMIDGMNYIVSPQSLLSMLKRIKTCFLNPDGLFIFDISSEYKLSSVLGNNTFIHNEKDVFYTWQNRYIKSKKISDMYLNFFVNDSTSYRRFEERHLQRAYNIKEMTSILKVSGFSEIEVYKTGTFSSPTDTDERLCFVAK